VGSCEIAELAVGVDDWSFIGGDGVGSVVEGGADMVDGGLAGFDVERRGFEENIGASGGEPVANVCQLSRSSGSLGVLGLSGRGRPCYTSI
jgi:hypothetical protein